MTTREMLTAYIQAIESMEPDAAEPFLHPDMENLEHPNKLNPTGKHYDRAALRAAAERGRAIMASQRYEVRHMIVEGDRAAIQMLWTGTLKVAAGPLPAGHVMRAEICSIIELRD